MERIPKKEITPTDWSRILEVRFAGSKKSDFKKPGVYGFSVTPNYTVLISNLAEAHGYLADKHGANLDETWTEGYLYIDDHGAIEEIDFKPAMYQKIPSFTGTPAELASLQNGVRIGIHALLEDPNTQ